MDSQDKPEEESSDDDDKKSGDEGDSPKRKKKAVKTDAEQQQVKTYDSITEAKLFVGLYELADNWTPNINSEEVIGFFKQLSH